MKRSSTLLLGAILALLCGCRPSGKPAISGKAVSPREPWFEDRAEAAGIRWRLGHGTKSPLNILEVMGGGCAVLDFDGDGWDDLFLAGQTGAGSTGRSALYRNRRDGTFQEVTSGSGLDVPGHYMGCATGDLDNDGRPDLFLTGYGVNRLFRNLGEGKFQDLTAAAGLKARGPSDWSTAAAFGDFDRDGNLDLYLGRYVRFDHQSRQFCDFNGTPGSCPPYVYPAQTGSLYRSLGGGRFQDATRILGRNGQHGKTLGAAFGDYDLDGRPDLYLGNDAVPCDLFPMVGSGGKNMGAETGTAYTAMATCQSAMGVDWADCNGDGRLDLVVTTFEREPVSLYLNRGNTNFQHAELEWGLDLVTRPTLGFGVRFADFDNDGWPDLAVANGHVVDQQARVDPKGSYAQPMQLFMNRVGTGFDEATSRAGSGFTTPAVGRGLATGDFNRDGRPDLLLVDLEGRPRLLMNRMPTSGSWLRLELRGRKSNRLGLGARITVKAGGRSIVRECQTGGSYLSASSPVVHVGLGYHKGPVQVTIRWPSGRNSALANLPINQHYLVDELAGITGTQ